MADMSGEQMQAKITAARREAEGLKDKIRRRKDDLADTTCTNFLFVSLNSTVENGRLIASAILLPPESC
jgi:hypothetical protein